MKLKAYLNRIKRKDTSEVAKQRKINIKKIDLLKYLLDDLCGRADKIKLVPLG